MSKDIIYVSSRGKMYSEQCTDSSHPHYLSWYSIQTSWSPAFFLPIAVLLWYLKYCLLGNFRSWLAWRGIVIGLLGPSGSVYNVIPFPADFCRQKASEVGWSQKDKSETSPGGLADTWEVDLSVRGSHVLCNWGRVSEIGLLLFLWAYLFPPRARDYPANMD